MLEEATANCLDPDRTGREAERLRANRRQRNAGQDEAIEQIAQVYQTNLAGMAAPDRSIANLLSLSRLDRTKRDLVESGAEKSPWPPASHHRLW